MTIPFTITLTTSQGLDRDIRVEVEVNAFHTSGPYKGHPGFADYLDDFNVYTLSGIEITERLEKHYPKAMEYIIDNLGSEVASNLPEDRYER